MEERDAAASDVTEQLQRDATPDDPLPDHVTSSRSAELADILPPSKKVKLEAADDDGDGGGGDGGDGGESGDGGGSDGEASASQLQQDNAATTENTENEVAMDTSECEERQCNVYM